MKSRGVCGEAQFVANKIIEHGAAVVPADRTMRLIYNQQVEVERRKTIKSIADSKRLHGGNDNLGPIPVVLACLVDDALIVVAKIVIEILFSPDPPAPNDPTRNSTRLALPLRRN